MYRMLLGPLAWCVLLFVLSLGVASAESVDITVPTSVGFSITDIARSTTGRPNPTTFSFADADLVVGHVLRISVKANTPDFIPPDGTAIPASNISWTISSPENGAGFNGNLSSASYTVVYQSKVNPTSGSVDLIWNLPAQGTGIRAGEHTLSLTWKMESVVP